MARDMRQEWSTEVLEKFSEWQRTEMYGSLNSLYTKWRKELVALGVSPDDAVPLLVALFIGYGINLQRYKYNVTKEAVLGDVSMIFDQLAEQDEKKVIN